MGSDASANNTAKMVAASAVSHQVKFDPPDEQLEAVVIAALKNKVASNFFRLAGGLYSFFMEPGAEQDPGAQAASLQAELVAELESGDFTITALDPPPKAAVEAAEAEPMSTELIRGFAGMHIKEEIGAVGAVINADFAISAANLMVEKLGMLEAASHDKTVEAIVAWLDLLKIELGQARSELADFVRNRPATPIVKPEPTPAPPPTPPEPLVNVSNDQDLKEIKGMLDELRSKPILESGDLAEINSSLYLIDAQIKPLQGNLKALQENLGGSSAAEERLTRVAERLEAAVERLQDSELNAAMGMAVTDGEKVEDPAEDKQIPPNPDAVPDLAVSESLPGPSSEVGPIPTDDVEPELEGAVETPVSTSVDDVPPGLAATEDPAEQDVESTVTEDVPSDADQDSMPDPFAEDIKKYGDFDKQSA